jgi:hypothetical protein
MPKDKDFAIVDRAVGRAKTVIADCRIRTKTVTKLLVFGLFALSLMSPATARDVKCDRWTDANGRSLMRCNFVDEAPAPKAPELPSAPHVEQPIPPAPPAQRSAGIVCSISRMDPECPALFAAVAIGGYRIDAPGRISFIIKKAVRANIIATVRCTIFDPIGRPLQSQRGDFELTDPNTLGSIVFAVEQIPVMRFFCSIERLTS